MSRGAAPGAEAIRRDLETRGIDPVVAWLITRDNVRITSIVGVVADRIITIEPVVEAEIVDDDPARGHVEITSFLPTHGGPIDPSATGGVLHSHGQHTSHWHSADDYAHHQRPIEGETRLRYEAER